MRRTVRIGARHILQDRPDSIEYFGPTLKSTPLGKTHWQYTHGVPQDRLDRIAPDAWQLDQAGLDRNGNDAIQLQLFWDYQFNHDSYPKFQEYFRTSQPPPLVVWGKNDEIFGARPVPRRSNGIYRVVSTTCSMPATSRWRPMVRRSPAISGISWADSDLHPHEQALRRDRLHR